MAEIIYKRNNKGDVENVVMKGVSLFYTCIQTPRAIYDDRKKPISQARKEYSVDVAGLTEDQADEWDEIFGKQVAKKHTNAKFKEHYKLEEDDPLPLPDSKKQYTLKLTQKAQKNDGETISDGLVPRVLMIEDGKAKDVTFTTLVGNGSKGDVMLRAIKNDYGQFSYLYRVKVTGLVEYEGAGSNADELDFLGVDEVELAEIPEESRVSGVASGGKEEEGTPSEDIDEDDF